VLEREHAGDRDEKLLQHLVLVLALVVDGWVGAEGRSVGPLDAGCVVVVAVVGGGLGLGE
jgi:hypothetical protein